MDDGGTAYEPRPHVDPGHLAISAPDDPEKASVLSDERTRHALELAPAVASRRGDAAILEVLREAEIMGIGRVIYSSNAVFLVELDAPDPTAPDERMRAIYKPRDGERPLWDFARNSLHLREVAAYAVDAALGTHVVPPTTLRDGPFGPGSLQLFIRDPDAELEGDEAENQIHGIATLDVITNNADRKRAHLLLGPGRHLWGIDNALTFLTYPRQRTVLIGLGGSAIAAREARRLKRLAAKSPRSDALYEFLDVILDSSEVAALRARVAELAADPRYPILDPWDGRPFETW